LTPGRSLFEISNGFCDGWCEQGAERAEHAEHTGDANQSLDGHLPGALESDVRVDSDPRASRGFGLCPASFEAEAPDPVGQESCYFGGRLKFKR
jgi:hypothetical protein